MKPIERVDNAVYRYDLHNLHNCFSISNSTTRGNKYKLTKYNREITLGYNNNIFRWRRD